MYIFGTKFVFVLPIIYLAVLPTLFSTKQNEPTRLLMLGTSAVEKQFYVCMTFQWTSGVKELTRKMRRTFHY